MKRKRRTRILVKDTSGLSSALAEEIRSVYPVTEIQAPKEGLVMVKLREQARNSLFYLGEVLVTEAKARVQNSPGLGLVQGNNEKLSRELAVIDAACNAHLPETDEWEPRLLDAERLIQSRESAEEQRILDTRVEFASMQEEDYV